MNGLVFWTVKDNVDFGCEKKTGQRCFFVFFPSSHLNDANEDLFLYLSLSLALSLSLCFTLFSVLAHCPAWLEHIHSKFYHSLKLFLYFVIYFRLSCTRSKTNKQDNEKNWWKKARRRKTITVFMT